MQIKVSEPIMEGALVCLATGVSGDMILLSWRYGCEAVGVAARALAEDELVEYIADKSTDDVLVKGSASAVHAGAVAVKVACDLKAEDLVCLRQQEDGEFLIDKWQLGAEAIGIATRRIAKNEYVEFCEGESTRDIHVKPHG